MEAQEIWKDIKGYEGYFQVSTTGNVRALERNVKGRIIKAKPRRRADVPVEQLTMVGAMKQELMLN